MSMYFYVNSNAQPNGDHEVHRSDCSWLPSAENRRLLLLLPGKSPLLTAGMARPVYGRAIFCEEGNVKL